MLSDRELFEKMIVINTVERELLRLFDSGKLRGTVHTCIGQEGVAVGVVGALDSKKDIVCSNHRGHGHFIAHAGDPRALIAEIMGNTEGVCGGIGGSQHLHTPNFYSNGVLGGMAPVATGMAFAERVKGSDSIVAVFLGDGSLGEGVIYEAFNMASLWKLPILFVIEANGYAQSTPIKAELAGELSQRVQGFGIASTLVDGNDVVETHRRAFEIVNAMRAGAGPHFLFCETYRLAPHSKGDDLRSPLEIAAAAERAPIRRLKTTLDTQWVSQIEQTVARRVNEFVAELAG